MARRLDTSATEFRSDFDALLSSKREFEEDVTEDVASILHDVRERGDAALIEYTRRFDKLELNAADLRLSEADIADAQTAADSEVVTALGLAADRIEAYHRRQLPEDELFTDEAGVRMGHRWTSIDAVGIYVPGGLASYPSSVLMNAIPARVAGVGRIAMAVPAPGGALDPLVPVAAGIAGVTEIYRIGGAQAVGALAYGTDTIAPVHKIVGPGNAWVAAAKRLVFGAVGIDMIAGPSEIVVLADGANDPSWIAADLMSQAEHDPAAQAVLITPDADLAEQVSKAVDGHLRTLPKEDIASASWTNHGAIVVVADLAEGAEIVNELAPEHLELAVEKPQEMLSQIRNAGAIFLGRHTPEAIGDYVGGPNHILPTSGTARFSSGLGVLDFMKRTSILECDADALGAIGPAAVRIAKAEGLDAHAKSVAIRLNIPDDG